MPYNSLLQVKNQLKLELAILQEIEKSSFSWDTLFIEKQISCLSISKAVIPTDAYLNKKHNFDAIFCATNQLEELKEHAPAV